MAYHIFRQNVELGFIVKNTDAFVMLSEKFKPEFAGQLNFYVTAVNKNMKDEQDNQTIGILICKDKDDVVAEYSLENISQPIGIAQYELTKVLSKEFESSLPTIEEIEEELSE